MQFHTSTPLHVRGKLLFRLQCVLHFLLSEKQDFPGKGILNMNVRDNLKD